MILKHKLQYKISLLSISILFLFLLSCKSNKSLAQNLSIKFDKKNSAYFLANNGASISKGYDHILMEDTPLIKVGRNNLYGAINTAGEEIIPLKYSGLRVFPNGTFAYKNSLFTETFHYNNKGEILSEMKLAFKCREINDEQFSCTFGTSRYIFNNSGDTLQRFYDSHFIEMDENLYKVAGVNKTDGYWIPSDQTVILFPIKEKAPFLSNKFSFEYRLKADEVINDSNDAKKLADKLLTDYPKLLSIGRKIDSENEAIGRFLNLQDISGKRTWIFDLFRNKFIPNNPFTGYQRISHRSVPNKKDEQFLMRMNSKDGAFGIINTANEIILPYEWDRIYFYNEYALLKKESSTYYINLFDPDSKTEISNVRFLEEQTLIEKKNAGVTFHIDEDCYSLDDNGLLKVKGEGLTALIQNGREKQLLKCYAGNIITVLNSKYGLVTKEGSKLLDNEFDLIDYNSEVGKFLITKNQKLGLADINGNIILDPDFDEIKFLHNSPYEKSIVVISRKGGKYQLHSNSGRQLTDETLTNVDLSGLPFYIEVGNNNTKKKITVDIENTLLD